MLAHILALVSRTIHRLDSNLLTTTTTHRRQASAAVAMASQHGLGTRCLAVSPGTFSHRPFRSSAVTTSPLLAYPTAAAQMMARFQLQKDAQPEIERTTHESQIHATINCITHRPRQTGSPGRPLACQIFSPPAGGAFVWQTARELSAVALRMATSHRHKRPEEIHRLSRREPAS